MLYCLGHFISLLLWIPVCGGVARIRSQDPACCVPQFLVLARGRYYRAADSCLVWQTQGFCCWWWWCFVCFDIFFRVSSHNCMISMCRQTWVPPDYWLIIGQIWRYAKIFLTKIFFKSSFLEFPSQIISLSGMFNLISLNKGPITNQT